VGFEALVREMVEQDCLTVGLKPTA